MSHKLAASLFSPFFSGVLTLLALLFSEPLSAGEPPLVVGMELAYPPFEMRSEEGNPSGVSVDLAQALGKSLRRSVEIRNLPFEGLIPALKTGRIDLIVSSMTATEERARSIDFSEPYLQTGLCLLVQAGSSIRNLADADQSGRVLVVKKGTTGHLFAVQNLRAAKPLVLDQEGACVLEVAQGKADAFIYDQMATYKNWRKNPAATLALLTPFRAESWAIGIRKGNSKLLQQVNGFLAEFRASGGFEELGRRWLAEEKAEFARLGLPFYF
jgi:polar amino acid transport system substrate-binding protein